MSLLSFDSPLYPWCLFIRFALHNPMHFFAIEQDCVNEWVLMSTLLDMELGVMQGSAQDSYTLDLDMEDLVFQKMSLYVSISVLYSDL